MVMMLARHKVADVSAFLAGYRSEAMSAVRDGGGVTADTVYATVEDGEDVLVWHEFATLEEGRAFVENPGLADAMAELGVIEAPKIQFFNEL